MVAANTDALPAAERPTTKTSLSADDFDEPTKAEIRDDLKIAFQQLRAGKGRPARVALAEIRREIQQLVAEAVSLSDKES